MAKLKKYNEFINESTTIDQDQNRFLKERKNEILKWFQEGEFQGFNLSSMPELGDRVGRNLVKDLIVNFNDSEYYYELVISVSQHDSYKVNKEIDNEELDSKQHSTKEEFSKMGVKIGKFNMDLGFKSDSITSKEIMINPDEFTPEYVKELIENLDPEKKIELEKEKQEEQGQEPQQAEEQKGQIQQGEIQLGQQEQQEQQGQGEQGQQEEFDF